MPNAQNKLSLYVILITYCIDQPS